MAEAERKIEVYYLLIDREKKIVLRDASYVELSPDTSVARMKDYIMQKELITLPDSMLTVWKCNDPDIDFNVVEADKLDEQVENAFSKGSVVRLNTTRQVGEVLHEIVLVEIPATGTGDKPHEGKKRKLGDDTGDGDVYDFRKEQDRTVKQVSDDGTSASKAAGERFARVQQTAPVYNGIPARNTVPPIELFHPIFDTFKQHLKETVEIPEDIRELAWTYSEACVVIYDLEADRENAMKEVLKQVHGMQRMRVQTELVSSDSVGFRSIGVPGKNQYNAIVVLEEIKNRFGKGGSDPYDQACFAYQRYWGDPKLAALRRVCYCPTFLITSAGPWMCVSGAIYLTDAIVQPLTTGYEWVGPVACSDVRRHRVERLFYALRKAIGGLCEYYESLSNLVCGPDVEQQVNGYPCIAGTDKFGFSYVAKLVPYNKTKLVYKARRDDNGDLVVVKFTGAYNEEAHRLLEAKGYAPALYHIGKTTHDLYMVVMQYVEGTQPSKGSLTEAQRQDIKKAIELLHAEDLVFGDLRRPNVLVKDDDGHALLLDFDGCGKDEKDRYPFDINMGLSWAKGVGPGAIMKKDHDWSMLREL